MLLLQSTFLPWEHVLWKCWHGYCCAALGGTAAAADVAAVVAVMPRVAKAQNLLGSELRFSLSDKWTRVPGRGGCTPWNCSLSVLKRENTRKEMILAARNYRFEAAKSRPLSQLSARTPSTSIRPLVVATVGRCCQWCRSHVAVGISRSTKSVALEQTIIIPFRLIDAADQKKKEYVIRALTATRISLDGCSYGAPTHHHTTSSLVAAWL